jgi:SPP1 gp7 family putative phage head morphogenesis protein
MIGGESRKTAAKRVQEALNTGRHSAYALADTAIRQAHNWAEREYHLENAERLKGLRFQAELDRRTCPQCIPKDNRVYRVKDAPRPPLHLRCRCFLTPVFKNVQLERYLARADQNIRIARIDTKPRTVHHRDGTTSTKYEKLRVKFPPARQNYNQWLTSMIKSSDPHDVAFAKEILGPSRFDLVKSGKLKMNQLYYAGKLRTIKQLKELMKK